MQITERSFRLLEDVAAWMLGIPCWSPSQLGLSEPDFPWAEGLVAARVHNLGPALGVYLSEQDLWSVASEPVREILTELKRNSDHRAALFADGASEVYLALKQQNIPAAVRKGLITRGLLYSAKSVRGFDDVDFLVSPENASATEAVLQQLGFQPGRLNRRSEQIARLSKEEIALIHSKPDHLLNYARLTGHRAVPAIAIDVALSFTWADSEYRLDVAEALACSQVVDIENTQLPRLDDRYMFIDCVMHLFREAFLESGIRRGDDVTLMRFVEVALFVRRIGPNPQSLEEVRALIDRNGLQKPAAWVLSHADSLFDIGAVSLLGLENSVEDGFLHAFRRGDGSLARWRGTIRDRLKDRRMMLNLLCA